MDQTDAESTIGVVNGWMLALDTSTEQSGIALTDGASLVELSQPGGRQQTTSILTMVDWLCERRGIGVSGIHAIAVAIGPGSFTGLRVGLSVAKGLALAKGAAVIGIPTLEIVAWSYRASGMDIVAVIPAGRSRFVWSRFDTDGTGTAPVNASREELIASLEEHPQTLVVGEFSPDVHAELEAKGLRLESRMLGTRHMAALADLGYRRWQDGSVDDPTLLEPFYLHGKQTARPPRNQH